MIGRSFSMVCVLIAVFFLSCLQIASLAEIPGPVVKDLPLAPENSVSTYLPSKAAPGQGLALNIIYPQKPRYKDGAPVAVVIPGSDGPDGLGLCIHAGQVGFIEVRFAFPGGGSRGLQSSGKSDYRGQQSQLALKDIALFAMNKLRDYQGRYLKELVPVKVQPGNVGLVGWSNGGNITLVTLDKYPDELKGIGWITFYESPLGSLFFPPSLGSATDLLVNRHYREGSGATGRCLIDYRKLAWDPESKRNPGVHKKRGEPEIAGVLYFDENGNKKWDESREFAFNYCLDRGLGKQIYPPEVTAACERLNVFEKGWPKTVATPQESETYFQERDGSVCIPSICNKYPQLLVTIFGSQIDHLQRQPDHPHIVLQYNSWLDNNVHWVRLNPEPIYVARIANMNVRNFVNNKPKAPIDATAINDHLELEGMLLDYVFVEACIAELADRLKTHNLKSPLDEPLVSYSNGLPIPPLTNQKPNDQQLQSKNQNPVSPTR